MKINKKYFPSSGLILAVLFAVYVTVFSYNKPLPVFFQPYLSWAGPMAGVIFGWGSIAALVVVSAGSFWLMIMYDQWRRDR